ncbi:invasion associated locus B family protein [Ciceribacter sp. RN22]|uniref:invasion associated locus B family protein n=1 Tax=Ciceribacter sp. RN22 TaxID=2954932 RepID=UPI0020936C86|nr:invasion associated locus B family protein [Ciceribacter sp. RN22]MCO6181002.1 invasion associated locus B family protein [Ciceribacter sp. RN22]
MTGRAIKTSQPLLLMLAWLCLTGDPSVAGQDLPPSGYRIKPSEVIVPADVPVGEYRRIIRPFENWTLVCDENLKSHQMVCNISQTIEDASGRLAFSWSLAATREGKPFMILRVPPSATADGKISLGFADRKAAVEVALDGCNETVCVGVMPVGPIMREQIAKQGAPTVSYTLKEGRTVSVTASLAGLATALKAIK